MYRLVLISHLLSLRSEARLASYLIGRWGRPCGARTSDHVIALATDHATHGDPYSMVGGGGAAGGNIQSGPEGQVFSGIVTHV